MRLFTPITHSFHMFGLCVLPSFRLVQCGRPYPKGHWKIRQIQSYPVSETSGSKSYLASETASHKTFTPAVTSQAIHVHNRTVNADKPAAVRAASCCNEAVPSQILHS